jgi:6-phosphogluconolactonase (cycloisomerase 2 family)
MRKRFRFVMTAVFAAVAVGTFATPAFAENPHTQHAVFVQTNDPAGNHIVAYDQHDDGTLTIADTYSTGGNGGALNGAVVDRLASQGSLAFDARHELLYAVNAGSNTVSVFGVDGDQLSLRGVVPSGGQFPVSVGVHGDLVYVLNARAGGSVSGFRVQSDVLAPIAGSTRALGLNPAATPEFTTTPGQVGFSPDGRQLLVTTKGNGSDVDVFAVGPDGALSGSPVVNNLPGAVPFAFDFDRNQNLVLTEAGPNSVESFVLGSDGSLTSLASVATGQAATCWVTHIGAHFYASNAGSGSLTQVDASARSNLSFVANTATGPGTVDAAVASNGAFLYVQTGGNGGVDAFRVSTDGSLTPIGTTIVPNSVGGEGIVAI